MQGYLVSLAITIDTTLGSPTPETMHLEHTNSALEALEAVTASPSLDHHTPAVDAAFDPLIARTLPQPSLYPFKIFDMLPWDQACLLLCQNINGFVEALKIAQMNGWSAWSVSDGLLCWPLSHLSLDRWLYLTEKLGQKTYFKKLARTPTPTLARSLAYSVFYSEPLNVVALRSDYKLKDLAISWAGDVAGVLSSDIQDWRELDQPLTQWWLSKLAGVRTADVFLFMDIFEEADVAVFSNW